MKENDSKSLLRTKIRERQQVVTPNEDKRTTASRYSELGKRTTLGASERGVGGF
ncbi:MAG: hypothetical protein ACRC8Y_01170 [Chroococcales cyanobacterium]